MPEPRLEIHPDVKDDDLVEITSYIASDNPVAAGYVYEAITGLFNELARHPLMGTEYSPLRRSLKGIRMMVVTEYPNYLIYYRPLPVCAFFMSCTPPAMRLTTLASTAGSNHSSTYELPSLRCRPTG
jgi:plasmid stabilization system protein ParE